MKLIWWTCQSVFVTAAILICRYRKSRGETSLTMAQEPAHLNRIYVIIILIYRLFCYHSFILFYFERLSSLVISVPVLVCLRPPWSSTPVSHSLTCPWFCHQSTLYIYTPLPDCLCLSSQHFKIKHVSVDGFFLNFTLGPECFSESLHRQESALVLVFCWNIYMANVNDTQELQSIRFYSHPEPWAIMLHLTKEHHKLQAPSTVLLLLILYIITLSFRHHVAPFKPVDVVWKHWQILVKSCFTTIICKIIQKCCPWRGAWGSGVLLFAHRMGLDLGVSLSKHQLLQSAWSLSF